MITPVFMLMIKCVHRCASEVLIAAAQLCKGLRFVRRSNSRPTQHFKPPHRGLNAAQHNMTWGPAGCRAGVGGGVTQIFFFPHHYRPSPPAGHHLLPATHCLHLRARPHAVGHARLPAHPQARPRPPVVLQHRVRSVPGVPNHRCHHHRRCASSILLQPRGSGVVFF